MTGFKESLIGSGDAERPLIRQNTRPALSQSNDCAFQLGTNGSATTNTIGQNDCFAAVFTCPGSGFVSSKQDAATLRAITGRYFVKPLHLLRLVLSGFAIATMVTCYSIGIAAADVVPPKVDMTTPTGVSIPDVTYRVSNTDLAIGSLTLQHFSQSPSRYWPNYSQFGMMMTSNFDIYVEDRIIKASGPPFNTVAHRHAVVHIGNSAYATYRVSGITGAGTVTEHNSDAYAGVLTMSGSAYQFTDKEGSLYIFSPSISAHPAVSGINYGAPAPKSQRVDHINFANGRVWQFYYDSSQRPKLVTDSAGYAILFDYETNGFVSDACAIDRAQSYVTTVSSCAGRALTAFYQYGSAPSMGGGPVTVLSGFTDVRGKTTSYTRSSVDPSISCVVPPGQNVCQMQLVGGAQTLADGSVWNISSSQGAYPVNDPEVPHPSSDGATVVDPNGKSTAYKFAGSSPLSVTNANGKTVTFKWCCSQIGDAGTSPTLDGTMLLEADFPEGRKYTALYGGPFNLPTQEAETAKPSSTLPDRIVKYRYGSCYAPGNFQSCGKPIWKIDENGNQTDWSYASWGGTLTEMLPAPTSGAARPLKLYSYIQKYAYVKNSAGALVTAGGPIWMLATETQCQTAAGSNNPVCDTAAPQRVTAYQYGVDGTADNLLLHGIAVTADGQTLRTCYGYDQYSNRISETKPRAGLSSCP